jgi:hypothetical protein
MLKGTASQAAEKLVALKGNGFSGAVNGSAITAALQAREKCCCCFSEGAQGFTERLRFLRAVQRKRAGISDSSNRFHQCIEQDCNGVSLHPSDTTRRLAGVQLNLPPHEKISP